MGSEAREAGSRRNHHHDHPQHGRSAAVAVLATALVTVALVPAATPTATAADASPAAEASCVPRDDPFDVGLVLDRSGSMTGDKIAAARTGGIQLLENLTPNDQSGLVSYASIARLDDPLGPDHGSTAQAVADLQAGGVTATGDAIHLSHEDLAENGREGLPGTMILLTDGKTNVGRDPVEQAREAKADGIEIYAIGVGSSLNEADLRTIASEPVEDHYFQVSNADDIVTVFQDLAGVISGEAPYAGEAYGAKADAASDSGFDAGVHKAAWTTAAGQENATAATIERSVAGYSLQARLADARTGGAAGPANVTATSTVRLEDLEVRGPDGLLLRADVLSSRAHAWSAPDGAGTSADGTHVAGLEVRGPGPVVEASAPVPPDTEVTLPGAGTLTLNEQTATRDGANVTHRTNLVHLEVDDGNRTGDLVAGSSYAAASCTEETSFGTPGKRSGAFSLETADEDVSAGPATVNPGGCAEGEVAASATGCSQGDVAVSGTDEARNRDQGDCGTEETCVAASGTGDARNAEDDCDRARACVAASGTGDARNAGDDCAGTGTACVAASGTGEPTNAGDCTTIGTACVAASGTGDADSTDETCMALTCVAVTGTGDAEGIVAVSAAGDAQGFALGASGTGNAVGVAAASGTGDAVGLVAVTGTGSATGTILAAGVTGTCNGRPCNDVNLTGPAQGHNTAVSGNGSSDARQGAAVSGTGPASVFLGAAASGTGPASSTLGAAASGTDSATGTVAITGTGSAQGTLLTAGLIGTCNGRPCNDAHATGPAQGHNTAVSGTDDADARQGAAVSGAGPASTDLGVAASGTGPADAGTGVGASGCTGVEASLVVTYQDVDSPAPVCSLPAAERSSLLP